MSQAQAHAAEIGQGALDARTYLAHEVEHFCHMLSEQGPMSITFVHNNTLLGLQKMHFEEAIKVAARALDGRGYLPNEEFRQHFALGRITRADLERALRERNVPGLDDTVLALDTRSVPAVELLIAHMVHGIEAIEVAELRDQVLDRRNTRRLRGDLTEMARGTLIASAATDLSSRQDSVGLSRTMGHWMQELTGLDVVGRLVAAVDEQLSGANAFAGAVEPNLRALGIPEARWRTYLDCIDQQFLHRQGSESQRAEIRELWLREEAALVDSLARRHFDVPGTLDADQHFHDDPEHFAALTMWRSTLRLLGLADALGASHPEHLHDHNPDAGEVEGLSEQMLHMQRWGGPPIPVDAAERSALEALIAGELATAHHAAAGGGSDLDTEHLCWIVLHDLGERHLNRRGMEALQALAEGGKVPPALAPLLARLQDRDPRRAMLRDAQARLDEDITAFGLGVSHADLLLALTGDDVAERVDQYMIRAVSAFLDEGLAAWHMPARALGFYDAWRSLAEHERTFDLNRLPGWREALHQLPTRADDAVLHCLKQLGIGREQWGAYLGRVLVRLKGWAGMVFWRQLHPKYAHQATRPIDVLQFLAVRLFYETLLVRDVCRGCWQIQPDVASLEHHFLAHPSEYFVRCELYRGRLPDYLAEEARALVEDRAFTGPAEEAHWLALADLVWSARVARAPLDDAADRGWRTFQAMQLLGLNLAEVRALTTGDCEAMLSTLDAFPPSAHGPVWLNAFERHYRDEILNALRLNHGRGRWLRRETRPKSQVILCIDEREESFHRHYEELDPGHETLGAAGFFGIAMDYVGLDDHDKTPLCPAVVTPAHRVYEIARPEARRQVLPLHRSRAKWKETFDNAYWELKRNLVSSYFLIDLVGFLSALPLVGRVFFPTRYFAMMGAGHGVFVPRVATRLAVSRDDTDAVPDHGHDYVRFQPVANPIGFTDIEQADRCEAMLRNTGLTYGFATIVVWCAHGSHSENNPHENAHDCGACGGKNGAPNGRAISAMLNRPVVRALLKERGIDIPADTWFLGGLHNTCSDEVTLYDTEDVPQALRPAFQAVAADLKLASMHSAHERCRRFGSSPKDASLEASAAHIAARAYDFSQVRPEWGHATNAFAVVGRRAVTQGAFFDRRPFIISYDPTQDATGKILERILMAVGPVGAGISLEYYFSTVDPKVYGCDTKVPHNVTGLFGVMEGAQSDLRTGLPRQMTEVHEAMRLQLIVDAKMEILGEIYGRQPAIQQLLNGQWVHLIAHDPDTGVFNMFVPGKGFVEWNEPLQAIPEVANSAEWYRGKYEGFLPPALIAVPGRAQPHATS
jgi:uncharacterized protein YbcC (UPF0753/DUF2309 family)